MFTTNSIDTKIITLLPALSTQQKKAVLTVVKTFVEEHTQVWDEDEYNKEMEKRFDDMQNGKIKPFTIHETIKAAKMSYLEKQKANNVI